MAKQLLLTLTIIIVMLLLLLVATIKKIYRPKITTIMMHKENNSK